MTFIYKKMQSHYTELEHLVEHLLNYRIFERYDLATLAHTVAIGIYDAVFCNCLRNHDLKHGSSLRSLVSAQPEPKLRGLELYKALLSFVAVSRINHVTIFWALRQFEKENDTSVIEILLESEKSFEQMMSDSLILSDKPAFSF
jgi:hypothetical protein